MVSYIVGIFFILLGILSFMFPNFLRTRLQKKAHRRIRQYFFGGAISLGILLISAGWKHEGFLPKILVLVGIIAIIKGVFFLKSKAADTVTQWLLKQPILFFKIFAAGEISLGLLILFGLNA